MIDAMQLIIQKLKKSLRNEKVFTASVECGQFLPEWRPDSDYQLSYSAKKSQGGGVLRDLSHEIDYSFFLLGKWKCVSGIISKMSDLKIETEDMVNALFKMESGATLSIQLDYLSPIPKRELSLTTDKSKYKIDLINGTFKSNNVVEQLNLERNVTYKAQLSDFLEGKEDTLCTFNEGLEIVKFIEKLEQASELRVWVDND